MKTGKREPLEVFYSYAHQDEVLRNELEKHLRILELQGLIKGWHDRNINAGIEWASEINEHLNTAHVILLLVSPDFLSSRYCYSIEMKRAMERHYAGKASVIPIILRPIHWQGAPFDKLQVLPTDAKPVTSWSSLDEAFLNVTIGIRKAIERPTAFSPATPIGEENENLSLYTQYPWSPDIPFSPYRGLQVFREQDAPFFFGRDILIEQLVESVQKRSFVAIIGPSGSGKSSLVLAGLLPRLRYEGCWHIATCRPSERPFHTLASALVALLEPELDEIDRLVRINKLVESLQRKEVSLHDVMERIAHKHERKILFLIDQFEELYTRCQIEEDRYSFLDLLAETIRSFSQSHKRQVTFVLTLRADFLEQALSHRSFADVLQFTDIKISPMNEQELHDAIVQPVQRVGVDIELGLASRIVEEVHHEPGNLPLLEFALEALWTKQSNKTLTHIAYQTIGGVKDAVANYAEEIYTKLNEKEQKQIKEVLIQLVHPGEGTMDTRRVATRENVGERNWDLVVHIADTRLVVCGRDEVSSEETVEVIHEALIQRWQRLRMWVDEYREFRIWQDRLRIFVRQWEKSAKDESALLWGVSLVEAVQWLNTSSKLLSLTERTFIEISNQHQQQQILLEERLATLNSALQSISSGLNLNDILDNLMRAIGSLLRIDICAFFQPSADGKYLVAKALYTPPVQNPEYDDDVDVRALILDNKQAHAELIEQISLPFQGTILEQQLHSGPFFMLDSAMIEELAQQSEEGGAIFLRDTYMQQLMMLPLFYEKEFIGMVAVSTSHETRRFSSKEISFLIAMSLQAINAIRNAQLFTDRGEAYAELQQLSRMKDEFMTTASHELRTPLSAITGYSTLLRRQNGRSAPLTTQQVTRYATKIASAAQQLNDIMANMTEASKIGTIDRKLELQIGPVRVDTAVEVAANMLSINIEQRISAEVNKDLYVFGDPLHTRQVMTNLLDNAAKYSRPQSNICITATAMVYKDVEPLLQNVQITGAERENQSVILVRVIDQGEGILPQDQKSIFDKFVRAPRSLKTPVRGAGLGLYICRRYIEAMNGKLWLERSAPNEGSTFSFYLPQAEVPSKGEERDERPFSIL